MSEELARTNSEGKLAKATGRFLVGNNQYATIAVTCHIRATQSSTVDDIERLGEQYLTAASTYALGLGRALAESGSPPIRLEVNAECELHRTSGEPRLSDLALEVSGDVHDCDQQAFEAAAGDAILLQSTWALPPTATVHVAARLNGEIDAWPSSNAPAEGLTAVLAQPNARRRARLVRRLVLLAALSAAMLVYLAIGTPAKEMFSIVQARIRQQLSLGRAVTSAAPTSVVAGGRAAASPTAQVAAVPIQPPAATASPAAVQAAGAISTALTSPIRQPTSPTGTPIPIASSVVTQLAAGAGFEETFASNERHWPDNPSSTAWLASGGYRLAARGAAQFVALRAPQSGSFRDVRVTGVFTKVAGPPGGGYGLILRDESPAPLDGITQTGRYYVFEVGDRDGVGIWRREGNQWVDILPWTPSAAVHGQNGTNELIAEAHGTRLDFFVNGRLVASGEDTALTEGSVGVFTGGDDNDVLLTRFAAQPLS